MSRGTARWLAWSLWTLCVAFAVFAVLIAMDMPPGPTKNNSNWGVVIAVSLLTYPTIGAIVASRRPENLIGWILCAIGLRFVIEGFALVYVGYSLSAHTDSLPGEKIAFWVAGWFDFPLVVLGLTLMILLFPDGRLPEPSWRALPWAAAGGSVLWILLWVTARHSPMNWYFNLPPSRNPLVVGSALRTFFEGLGTIGGLAVVGIGVASVISLISRWDSARGDERQQIKWFAYAAVVLVGVPLIGAPFVAAVTERMGGSWEVGLAVPPLASLLGIPVAVGIAILKYRLYDIDVVINRTLVYGSLTVMLALGRLVGDRLVSRFGAVRVLWVGAVVAGAGFGGALLLNNPPAGVVGLGLLGVGSLTPAARHQRRGQRSRGDTGHRRRASLVPRLPRILRRPCAHRGVGDPLEPSPGARAPGCASAGDGVRSEDGEAGGIECPRGHRQE